MTFPTRARSRATSTLLALAGALVLAACASTQWVSTWKTPDAGPIERRPGSKIVALVMQPDEDNRRTSENVLAGELTLRGASGVPSYTLLPPEELRNETLARTNFEAAGVSGVVVMRLVSADTRRSYSPATYYSMPYYNTFWNGYYNYGWGAVYSPGYMRTDTIVAVETLVYDLERDKLLWAGTSKTTNPKDANAFIRQLVAEAVKEMRKAGLLTN